MSFSDLPSNGDRGSTNSLGKFGQECRQGKPCTIVSTRWRSVDERINSSCKSLGQRCLNMTRSLFHMLRDIAVVVVEAY